MVDAILPDILKPSLLIVFCGTAVGETSAKQKAYYAGPGNRFWSVLYKLSLTPYKFSPHEFQKLLKYGVGLTDLVKVRSGQDRKLSPKDYDVAGLEAKIRKFAPRILVFNGKKAAEVFLGRKVQYGLQDERIGNTLIFVLPSTSAAANKWWKDSYVAELAELLAKVSDECKKSLYEAETL